MSIVEWKNLKKAFHAYGKEPNFNVWQARDGRHRISNGYFVINTKEQPKGAGLTFLINNFNEMPEPNSLMKRYGKNHVDKLTEENGHIYEQAEGVIDNVSHKNDIPSEELEMTGIKINQQQNDKEFESIVLFNRNRKEYVFVRKELIDIVIPGTKILGSSASKPVYFVEDTWDEENRDFVMIMPIRQVHENEFLANPEHL